MATQPIPARHCASLAEVLDYGVGAFCYADNYTTMYLWLPNDTGPSAIRTGPGEEHPRWTLAGTEAQPTLQPSLNVPGVWHGWLTDGQFISC